MVGMLIASLGALLVVIHGVRTVTGTDPLLHVAGVALAIAFLWIGAELLGGDG